MKFSIPSATCLLLAGFAYCQQPGNVPGSTLWLKNQKVKPAKVRATVEPTNVSYTHFNFNPVLSLDSDSLKVFRGVISNQYSFFAVFKSDFEEERPVINLIKGNTDVLISNKAVYSGNEVTYKDVDARKGFMLSYLNGNNDRHGKRRNRLAIDDIFGGDKEGKEQLMEIVYFPFLVSSHDRQKVETYLSLKYGISMLGEVDYLDSAKDKIWDSEKNSIFSTRVTGIGRDDAMGLYQKQSGNSQKDGIYIGAGTVDTTNVHNKYILNDRSFALWGDNNGKTVLSNDRNAGLKKMERLWKIQFSGIKPADSLLTQLRVNKKELGYENKSAGKEFLWLARHSEPANTFDYTSADYIMQSAEDEDFVYFDDLLWDKDGSGDDIFTFIQGPDFLIEHQQEFSCASAGGSVIVKFIGGVPPYQIVFNGNESSTVETSVSFLNLQESEYSLEVSDARNKTLSAEIDITVFNGVEVNLSPLWYLKDRQGVVVLPEIKGNDSGLRFEWKQDGSLLSNDKEFIASKSGHYTLSVNQGKGCVKDYSFTVLQDDANIVSGWKLYPSPVKKGEHYIVDFNLEKETNVSLRVNSMEGKEIISKTLGVIKNLSFRDAISTSGVYLLTVTIGNTSETVKFIVN